MTTPFFISSTYYNREDGPFMKESEKKGVVAEGLNPSATTHQIFSTTLEPIGPDGIENSQEGYAHIGEDGSPHGGQAEDGQDQEEGLNA